MKWPLLRRLCCQHILARTQLHSIYSRLFLLHFVWRSTNPLPGDQCPGGLFSTLSHSAVSGGTCIPLGQALVLLVLLWHCQGLILQVGGGRRQRL